MARSMSRARLFDTEISRSEQRGGDLNFDATRMVFENVVAESGGGHLNMAAR